MPTVTLSSSVPKSASAVDIPITTGDVAKLSADKKKAAKLQGFEGKPGQTLVLSGSGSGPVEVLVGLGPKKEITLDRLRQAAAAFARSVVRHNVVATTMADTSVDGVEPSAVLAAVVEGVRLSTYRFTAHKSKVKDRLGKVVIVSSASGRKADLTRVNAVVDAVELARDLVNEPGGSLTPAAFVAAAKRHAGAGSGLKLTVWDTARIKREKLGGLLAVNQGSVHPPKFLILDYKPKSRPVKAGSKKKPVKRIALVGKGITFDSGGLSLKTATGMMTMKGDMAGAAAVLGAMTALAKSDVPVAVTCYIPLTDNMTGGDAQRPGDVFTARNGKTVEVLNTDAEGRLVLADALSLAAESEPDAIIDMATLTGSASAALGTSYAALMATDDKLAARIEQASARTGEKLWRLPLPTEYRRQLDSQIADLKNIGAGPYGGALVAGLFLKEFAGSKPWAHIDIGLAMMSDVDRSINRKGATGYGVRVLVDLLRHWK